MQSDQPRAPKPIITIVVEVIRATAVIVAAAFGASR